MLPALFPRKWQRLFLRRYRWDAALGRMPRELQQPFCIDFKHTKPVTESSSLAHLLPLLLCVLPPSSLDPYVVLDMPDSSWREIFGQAEALRSSKLTKIIINLIAVN